MAAPATIRTAPLQPDDWIRAGFACLSRDGIESVRIEVLARDLGMSKGSFYWHFHGREDLLEKMLARWENEELKWLDAVAADVPGAAARWAQFVERSAQPERIRREAGIRAWARKDERVAGRVAAAEKKKVALIADVLRDVGFTRPAAESWSEVVLLVCLGWIDRATRDNEFELASRGLNEFLSDLVLAASARTSGATR